MKLKLSLLVAVFVAAVFIPAIAAAQQVTLMTGPQGGVWVPLGGALKGMWEKAIPGLQVQMQPGAGIANVRGVDEGKAHIGFANTITTVDGLAGRPPYPKQGDQGVPGRQPLSAVLPDGGAGRREHQQRRRHERQGDGDPAEGQLLGDHQRAYAAGLRHDLPVAVESELPRLLHRCGVDGEGRSRARYLRWARRFRPRR